MKAEDQDANKEKQMFGSHELSIEELKEFKINQLMAS